MRRLFFAVLVAALALAAGPAAAKTAQAPKVKVTLLDGSTAKLDLGGGNVRTTTVSGTLAGRTLGAKRIDITKPINVRFTTGTITFSQTNVFDDPNCAETPLLRTDPASVVHLDKKKKSAGVLTPKGTVTGDVRTVIRLVLQVRSSGGCGAPMDPTGYADTPVRFKVKGKLDPKTGLQSVHLVGKPAKTMLNGCITAGTPSQKCAGKPLGYKATITVDLLAKIELGLS